jgi:hypothetical protein
MTQALKGGIMKTGVLERQEEVEDQQAYWYRKFDREKSLRQVRAANQLTILGKVQVGLELIRAKALLEHGEWIPYLKDAGLAPKTWDRRKEIAKEFMKWAGEDDVCEALDLIYGQIRHSDEFKEFVIFWEKKTWPRRKEEFLMCIPEVQMPYYDRGGRPRYLQILNSKDIIKSLTLLLQEYPYYGPFSRQGAKDIVYSLGKSFLNYHEDMKKYDEIQEPDVISDENDNEAESTPFQGDDTRGWVYTI